MALPWQSGRIKQGITAYFINITIGGKTYQLPNNNVMEFSLNRKANNVAFFKVIMFDVSGTELEYNIATSDKQVAFSYGTSLEAMSPVWYGIITSYSHNFESSGITMQIEGTGFLESGLGIRHNITYAPKNPTEVFRQIATRNNWTIRSIVETEDIKEPIVQNNVSDYSFICNTLIPLCRAKDTQSKGFLFIVDGYDAVASSQNGTITPIVSLVKDEDIPVEDERTLYLDYNGTANSTLIDFTPEVSGNVVIFGGSVQDIYGVDMNWNPVIDAKTGKPQTQLDIKTYNGVIESVSGFENIRQYGSYRVYDDLTSPMHLPTNIIDSQTLNIAAHHWAKAFSSTQKATCKILGDPSLYINQVVNINVTLNDGRTHYTSGLYRILGINDVLNSSGYYSTLTLIRWGNRLGSSILENSTNTDSFNLSIERRK